jgi:hypothetical protein
MKWKKELTTRDKNDFPKRSGMSEVVKATIFLDPTGIVESKNGRRDARNYSISSSYILLILQAESKLSRPEL